MKLPGFLFFSAAFAGAAVPRDGPTDMWVVTDEAGAPLFVAAVVEDGEIPALDRLVAREARLFPRDVARDSPRYSDAPAPPRESLFWKACGLVLVVGTLLSTQVPAAKTAAAPAPWRRRPKRASPKKAARGKRAV